MSRKIHFISGLPRSGSTLLAALLRQNPAVRAEMSSPVAVLCERMLPVMGHGEYATFFDDATRRDLLCGVVESYYRSAPPDAVLFDSNRAWCARMRVLADLYPDSHVIACVRDPVWVLDSFERLFRANTYLVSKLHGVPHSATVFDRVEHLMSPQGAFGAAWQALQDAFYGEFAHRLILLDYDSLVDEPHRVMALLYELLGIPSFAHDFEAIDYAGGRDFDAALNTPGLHRVGRRVERPSRRLVLPPQIVHRLANSIFWRKPEQNSGGAWVIAPDA